MPYSVNLSMAQYAGQYAFYTFHTLVKKVGYYAFGTTTFKEVVVISRNFTATMVLNEVLQAYRSPEKRRRHLVIAAIFTALFGVHSMAYNYLK